jgi:1-acyl-sn-glycerol-3-phosphate acyltransferase
MTADARARLARGTVAVTTTPAAATAAATGAAAPAATAAPAAAASPGVAAPYGAAAPRSATAPSPAAAPAAAATAATTAPRTGPALVGDGSWHEPLFVIWARRALSIPGLLLLTAVYAGLLVPLIAYGVAADLVRRRPMLIARFHVTMVSVLVWHLVGLGGLVLYWVAGLGGLPFSRQGWRAWNRSLEAWWGSAVIGIAELVYGTRVEVCGAELLAPGPVLVFARHTSIIDTMLPLRLIERDQGMIARIIKKRILLWDPCVDAISQRMPRSFVRRGSRDHALDVAMVKQLAAGMGAVDALWMYPEGTRFTASKRASVLAKLRERHPEAAERAERLQYTLPPRPGGTLALLDACPDADVVFCAHTGMEGANRLAHFIDGSLLRRQVEIELWRVPAREIPKDAEAQLVWLHAQWERVDRWVAEHQDPDLTALTRSE